MIGMAVIALAASVAGSALIARASRAVPASA